MLVLVLHHQTDHKAFGEERGGRVQAKDVQHVEGSGSHLGEVTTSLAWTEERERRTVGSWMAEGVVDGVERRGNALLAAGRSDQPQVFVVSDVSQVPDQR